MPEMRNVDTMNVDTQALRDLAKHQHGLVPSDAGLALVAAADTIEALRAANVGLKESEAALVEQVGDADAEVARLRAALTGLCAAADVFRGLTDAATADEGIAAYELLDAAMRQARAALGEGTE